MSTTLAQGIAASAAIPGAKAERRVCRGAPLAWVLLPTRDMRRTMRALLGVSRDGRMLGRIEGRNVATALLAVWLEAHPLGEPLKRRLPDA